MRHRRSQLWARALRRNSVVISWWAEYEEGARSRAPRSPTAWGTGCGRPRRGSASTTTTTIYVNRWGISGLWTPICQDLGRIDPWRVPGFSQPSLIARRGRRPWNVARGCARAISVARPGMDVDVSSRVRVQLISDLNVRVRVGDHLLSVREGVGGDRTR